MDLVPHLVHSSATRTPKTYCRSESSTITNCPSPELVDQHYSISSFYDLDLSSCSMASPYPLSRPDQTDQQPDWNPDAVLHPSLTSSRASLSNNNSASAEDDPCSSYEGEYRSAPAASSPSKAAATASSLQRDSATTDHGYPHDVEVSQYPSPSIAHAPYPPAMNDNNNNHHRSPSSQQMRHMVGPPAPNSSLCILDDTVTDCHQTTDRYNIAKSDDLSQQQQPDADSAQSAGLLPVAQHDTQGGGSNARARQHKAPRKLTSKEDANFECPVEGCGKLFSRSYNYKTHMQTHQEKRAYPFPCLVQDCTKKFVRKTDLRRHHQSVHMKERNYKCEFCGRGFSRRDTLGR